VEGVEPTPLFRITKNTVLDPFVKPQSQQFWFTRLGRLLDKAGAVRPENTQQGSGRAALGFNNGRHPEDKSLPPCVFFVRLAKALPGNMHHLLGG
jgi:hypothetical protein